MIVDWQKWMDQHHIKLRGDPNDNRSDAVQIGGGISRSKVETQSNANAGQSGRCYLQKHVKN